MHTLLFTTLLWAEESAPPSETDSKPQSETDQKDAASTSETEAVPTEKPAESPAAEPVKEAAPVQPPETPASGPKIKVEKVIQTVFPVLHNGKEESLVFLRAKAATKKEADALRPVTMSDIASGRLPVVLRGGEAKHCSGAPISMARIKMMVQQAENELAYFELEKAKARLNKAAQGLGCLREPVDAAIASRLYLLRGITAESLEDVPLATTSFEGAVVFNPAMEWDNYFAPHFKPRFDAAKKQYAMSKEVPLRIIPNASSSMIWLNGIPVAAGEEIGVIPGQHLIQFDADQMITTTIVINPLDNEAMIVAPSVVPTEASAWVEDEAKQKDLSLVLSGILEPDSTVYVHNGGNLYATQIGSETWEQLAVPRNISAAGQNTQLLTGQIGMWTGAVVTVVGGGLLAVNALRAAEADRLGQSTDSFSVYQTNEQTFYSARDGANLGLGLFLGGAALTGGGFWLQYSVEK